MTYLYKDGQTCTEHGFVVSPDGTCVRCRSEAAAAESRKITQRLAGAALLVILLGGGAAWGHLRTKSAEPAPTAPVAGAAEVAPAVPAAPEVAPEPVAEAPSQDIPRSPVTSPDTHAVLDAWQAELAKAEAKRANELALEARSQAAAERQQFRDAVTVPRDPGTAHPRRVAHNADPPSSADDHPSWWQDAPAGRRVIQQGGAQQRAMVNAGVLPSNLTNPNPSAWLPPNTGGNFGNRSGSPSH